MTTEWIVGLVTIFGTVASVSGVVLYLFINGTKKIVSEIRILATKIDERTVEIAETSQQNHKEVVNLISKIVELIDVRMPASQNRFRIKSKQRR